MRLKNWYASLCIMLVIALSMVFLKTEICYSEELTEVKLGYLHTLAVDGQLWLGEHYGFWNNKE